jgi:hypothetical protein
MRGVQHDANDKSIVLKKTHVIFEREQPKN